MSAHEQARDFLKPQPGVSSFLHITSGHAQRMIAEYDQALNTIAWLLTEYTHGWADNWCPDCGWDWGTRPEPCRTCEVVALARTIELPERDA